MLLQMNIRMLTLLKQVISQLIKQKLSILITSKSAKDSAIAYCNLAMATKSVTELRDESGLAELRRSVWTFRPVNDVQVKAI